MSYHSVKDDNFITLEMANQHSSNFWIEHSLNIEKKKSLVFDHW